MASVDRKARYAARVKKRWATLRWLCTASLAVVLAAYVFTVRYTAIVVWGYNDDRAVQLSSGFVSVRWAFAGTPGKFKASLINRKHPFYWGVQAHRLPWSTNAYGVNISLWCPTLVLAVPTVMLWRSHRRYCKTERPCPKCNYSLTGLPAGSACPECGGGKAKPS